MPTGDSSDLRSKGPLMPKEDFDIDSLARYLHITPRKCKSLPSVTKCLPVESAGSGSSRAEIHHWLEERIGLADDVDLRDVENVLRRAAGELATPERIAEQLTAETIAIPLEARTRSSVIKAMVDLAASTGLLWDTEKMLEAVRERENLHPTATRKRRRAIASAATVTRRFSPSRSSPWGGRIKASRSAPAMDDSRTSSF